MINTFKILTFLSIFWLSGIAKAEPSPGKHPIGAVYSATNYDSENSLVGYLQYSDGTLEKIGEFKTGGKGTGLIELFDIPYDESGLNTFADGIDPLASAYGVWKSQDQKNVLVVNPGNATVSSMRVQPDMSLSLTNVVAAGGPKPLAIASHGDLVYVSSLGEKKASPNNGFLAGFKIDDAGTLKPIPDSTRSLSARPASVEFTQDGKYLMSVTITTGVIDIYAVNKDGTLSQQPISSIDSPTSEGRFFALPIGTDIIPAQNGGHYLFVTETRFVTSKGEFNDASELEKKRYPFLSKYSGQTGSVSSYLIDEEGQLHLISADVLAGHAVTGGQQATCWVVVSPEGDRMWVTSPLTSSVSAYQVYRDGNIRLSEEIDYQAPDLEKYFLDMDLSADGRFFNVISGNTGEIFVFEIQDQTDRVKLVGAYDGVAKIHSYGLVSVAAPLAK